MTDAVLPQAPAVDPAQANQSSNPATATAPTDSSVGDDSGQPPQKNPLDILQELLNESKKDAPPEVAPTAAAADPAASSEMTPEQRAELDAKIEAQRLEDEQQVAKTLEELEAVKTTPQYQARVDQIQGEEEVKDQEELEHQGHQIRQLGHTTI